MATVLLCDDCKKEIDRSEFVSGANIERVQFCEKGRCDGTDV
jgi:hypothetical protein